MKRSCWLEELGAFGGVSLVCRQVVMEVWEQMKPTSREPWGWEEAEEGDEEEPGKEPGTRRRRWWSQRCVRGVDRESAVGNWQRPELEKGAPGEGLGRVASWRPLGTVTGGLRPQVGADCLRVRDGRAVTELPGPPVAKLPSSWVCNLGQRGPVGSYCTLWAGREEALPLI